MGQGSAVCGVPHTITHVPKYVSRKYKESCDFVRKHTKLSILGILAAANGREAAANGREAAESSRSLKFPEFWIVLLTRIPYTLPFSRELEKAVLASRFMVASDPPTKRVMGKSSPQDTKQKVKPTIVKTKGKEKKEKDKKVTWADQEPKRKSILKRSAGDKGDGGDSKRSKREKPEKEKSKKEKKEEKQTLKKHEKNGSKKEKKSKPDVKKIKSEKSKKETKPVKKSVEKVESSEGSKAENKKSEKVTYVPVQKDMIEPIFSPSKSVKASASVPETDEPPTTPIANNRAIVEDNMSDSVSNVASPALISDLADLKRAQAAAAAKGISLEDYLSKESAAAMDKEVDARMQELHALALSEASEKGCEQQETIEKAHEVAVTEVEAQPAKPAEETPAEEPGEKVAASEAPSEPAAADGGEVEEGSDEPEDEDEEQEDEETEEAVEMSEKGEEDSSSSDSDSDGSGSDAGSDEEEEAEADGDKGQETKEETKDGNDGKMGAVVAASKKAEVASAKNNGPNSITNKREWDTFSRQCLDRKKFPVSLAGHVLKSKLDVFQEWMKASGDWSAVALTFERKVTESRRFKKKRGGMKKRDIEKAYPAESLAHYDVECKRLCFLYPTSSY